MRTPGPESIPQVATGDTARLRTLNLPQPVAAPAPAQPAPPPVEEKPMLRETLEAVALRIQDYLERNGRKLEFSVDDASGRMVISVRDSNGELIRQIPNKEALEIAQRLSADSGTLFDQMV